MNFRTSLVAFAAFAAATVSFAADLSDADREAVHKSNVERAEKLSVLTAAMSFSNFFSARGLIADRANRVVTLYAEASGLNSGSIVEFPVIGENSSHDYESLFVTFAKPSDIVKALDFIGMKPGRPVDYGKLCFWPKGERVIVSVAKPEFEPVRIEEFLHDSRTEDGRIPLTGVVYCGSFMIDRDGEKTLAADSGTPGSVISSYNEPSTLFDFPRIAPQGDVYNQYVAASNNVMEYGTFVEISIRPEPRPEGKPFRVKDFTYDAKTGVQSGALSLADIRSCLPDQDPYVTLNFPDDITIGDARRFATALALIDKPDGIRVEPPLTGQLYYKAFIPNNEWRDRAKRPSQPCELRFTEKGGVVSATLVHIKEIWSDGSGADSWKPELKPEEIPLASASELLPKFEGTKVPINVLLVFAPDNLKLGTVMEYIRALPAVENNVHIFSAE